jgi:carboxypeptidase Taq
VAGEALSELRERIGQVVDVGKAVGLLGWDQRTYMPPGGASDRAEQIGTLTRIAHELFTDDRVGELLEELEPAAGLDPDSDDACLIRLVRRDFDKSRCVPAGLRAEMSRASALAQPAWQEARAASRFDLFLPHLERAFELRREYVACFDGYDEDYDVLLDDFEPAMKTAEVRAVFGDLKAGLGPLIAEIGERSSTVGGGVPSGSFPRSSQEVVERAILDAFGFDPETWRLDETAHPFAFGMAIGDIRLTTHHHDDNLTALFATMHEFGHGLYERSVAPELGRTPLARGASLAWHESQSRLWENLVGRSRPFWRRFFPVLQQAFSGQFRDVDAEGFYRAVNRVEPSLIRIHADEATYNLHIILRFELEQDLLGGRLAYEDAPEAWNAKMKEYLGIEAPDVADGVLQDTHWASGHIGYFSTYALGNILSAQLWERIRAEAPDLETLVARADFAPLRGWLRENLHRHGKKYLPQELATRVLGGPIDPKPLLAYLRAKFGEIYGLE